MKYLERAYPWLLLAPLILPLVIWNGLIYPYLVPKTLLFLVLTLTALASFALLLTHRRAFYFSRLARWEAAIPALLLLIAYGTSLVGIDFYRSFWSVLARGDGLLLLTAEVTSFYLILLTTDQLYLTRLMRGVASVAGIVALYGVGEWLSGGGRIGSLLGNAAFFAGYLGIALFATLLVARELSGGWKKVAYGAAGVDVLAIILSATRGTMLAILLAGLCYLIYQAMSGAGKMKHWSRATLALVVVVGTVFIGARGPLSHSSFGPVARVASIGTGDADIANRLFVWKHMVAEIEKSPWVGVGAEHIDVLFNRFYDPSQISEQWFDRSHNAFLDYFAQYGVGGLLLYLALLAAFLTTARRFWRRGEREKALLTTLLVLTYAVQNFFVFDTVSSFWLLLALLAVLLGDSLIESPREVLPLPSWMAPTSWVVALFLVWCMYPMSIQPAEAAYDLAHAYLYQLTDVPQEVSYLSHGRALGTYADLEYGYEAYEMYTTTQVTKLSGEAKETAYRAALSILSANFNRYPYDARTALYLAHVVSLAPSGVSIDQNLLSAALSRAMQFSPMRAQAWYILANLSLAEANQYPMHSAERTAGYAATKDILDHYIAMVPKLSMPHFVLAQLLLASGDTKAAAAEAALGKTYYVKDLDTALRAVGYYENVLDLPNAAFFLQQVVTMDPTNAAAQSDLDKIQVYEKSKS